MAANPTASAVCCRSRASDQSSTNCRIELEPMKVRGKKKSRHELLHLYLDRLEEVHRAYLELFALADKDITARSEVMLWATQADHTKAGQAFCGYTTPDVPAARKINRPEAALCMNESTRSMCVGSSISPNQTMCGRSSARTPRAAQRSHAGGSPS